MVKSKSHNHSFIVISALILLFSRYKKVAVDVLNEQCKFCEKVKSRRGLETPFSSTVMSVRNRMQPLYCLNSCNKADGQTTIFNIT